MLCALQLPAGRLHARTCLHLQQACQHNDGALPFLRCIGYLLGRQAEFRQGSDPSKSSLYRHSYRTTLPEKKGIGRYQDYGSAAGQVGRQGLRSPPALLDHYSSFLLGCSRPAHQKASPAALYEPGSPVLPSQAPC